MTDHDEHLQVLRRALLEVELFDNVDLLMVEVILQLHLYLIDVVFERLHDLRTYEVDGVGHVKLLVEVIIVLLHKVDEVLHHHDEIRRFNSL